MLHDTDTLPGLAESDALGTLTPEDAHRFRIVVEQDAYGFDGPLQWGGMTCLPLALAYGYLRDGDTPREGDDPLDLARALDRFGSGVSVSDRYRSASDRIADAAIRWASIFHGRTVARWAVSIDQSTYVDGLVYLDDAEDAAIAPDLDTLTQWARGEVYTVRLERNVADDLSDPDAADWRVLDSIGGTYFDADHLRNEDAYGPAACAAEQFGVPLDFARALEVVDA